MNLNELFNKQKKLFQNKKRTDLKERIKKIKQIRSWLKENEKLVIESILKDYNKPLVEIYTTEFKPLISHIDFTLKNIKKWYVPKKKKTPFHLLGTSSKILYEPKGICLIISPWNYPLNLTLNPLVSSIAAGNFNFIKPSEFTPYTSELIDKMINEIFLEQENIVVLGNEKIGKELTRLPFDHIFFTGSPTVGKKIMKEASQNLCSVTLELGGRNHTIVDQTADLNDAVEKIIWSKFLNAGQTCIACNHVFVHKNIKDLFYKKCLDKIKSLNDEKQITQIVNSLHYKRIAKLINICLEHSGEKIHNNQKLSNQFIPVIAIKNVSINNPILSEEIFGPILPIVEYENINEVINYIKTKEKPLAIYVFSKNKLLTNQIIQETSSGGVVVNDCIIQYMNPNLPFGGVNHSGIGKSGGKRTFINFSNEKSILIQTPGFSIAKLLYPPYTDFKKSIARKIPWFFN